MIMPEEKQCDIYFDPLLFVWAKVLAEEIYNESIDSKSMDVPESELWYQGEQPIVIEFLKRGQIKIWSNRAIKKEEK